MLAGIHVGRAVCTVSSGYCRLAGGDYTRIHAILNALGPALVCASDTTTYAGALADAGIDAQAVYSRGAGQQPGAIAFEQLAASAETPAVMQAFDVITPTRTPSTC